MEILTKDTPFTNTYSISSRYNPNTLLFFDIETTGFSPEHTTLYLIGCLYFEQGVYKRMQWFNNDGLSEQAILTDFLAFTKKFTHVIHYNGDGFDIPYIKEKCKTYGIEEPFSHLVSIDIYKKIRPLKNILPLTNLKQKSIEAFLSIHRNDIYDGGKLIKVYNQYLKDQNQRDRHLLLQHNYEDVEGLLFISEILNYMDMTQDHFIVEHAKINNQFFNITLSLPYNLPKRFVKSNEGITLTGFEKTATLKIPIIMNKELKFFFPNYRDYYFLPAEDKAIHKSVAAFVDKEHKTKAKKENCYCKKIGDFIPIPPSADRTAYDNMNLYKESFQDKKCYFELDAFLVQSTTLLTCYTKDILSGYFFT